jgi:EmrB/QacA subfamily drug resistance transporter
MTLFKTDLSQRSNYKWIAFLAIAIGTFTSVADHGSVIVALPFIAEHFQTDLPTTQWVMIGYALAISALLLPMGRLSDIVGLKRVYITGFAIFVISAALAGYAPNIITLILFKVTQGIGAAMTQGTGMAMLLSTFPDNERGRALGLHLSTVGVGNVAGPAIGGFIVGALGWPWVFHISAIMGSLSIIPAFLILNPRLYSRRNGTGSSFDWFGAGFSTGALVLFLLGVTNGSKLGWASFPTVGSFVLLIALVTAFIWWELRTSNPMFDVRQFRHRLFSVGVAALFITFIGQSSVRFLMPFYLQAVKGFSPAQIGLILVPAAFTMVLIEPLSGRLSDRFGTRKFMLGGMTISALALLGMSTLTVDSSFWHVVLGMVFMSAGMATFYAPNNSSILSAVEKSRYGVMSGFLNLVRNAANVTGVAVVTAMVTMVMASMGFAPTLAAVSGEGGAGVILAFVSGLQVGYKIMAGLVFAGILIAFFRGRPIPEPAVEEAPGSAKAIA